MSVQRRADRLAALDAFRGITIAGMILVNAGAGYAILDHADWNGLTFADLVFPWFVFIVGVSIALSLSRSVKLPTIRRILVRGAVLFALGAVIFIVGRVFHSASGFHWASFRIAGVLQRIAICYVVAALVYLQTGWRMQFLLAVATLAGYWIGMVFIPIPGHRAGDLSMDGNLAAFIDRAVLHPAHMYTPSNDPEGILSTFPAIASALFGLVAGHWLQSPRAPQEKLRGMVFAGLACIILALLWNPWFPINKTLWSSSFVLISTGLGLWLLSLCYWIIDIHRKKDWALPLFVLGTNSIAAYLFSVFVKDVPGWDSLEGLFQGWIHDDKFAQFALASIFVVFCTFAMWLLYRRKIFLRV